MSKLAPAVMAATGAIQVVEALVFTPPDTWAALAGFVVPTIGTTATSWFLARGRWGRAGLAVAGWAALHALVAVVASAFVHESAELLVFCVMLVSGITLAFASPALVATAVLGRRGDFEAGDAYLTFVGAWFAALQTLEMIVFQENQSWALGLPGFVVGLGACGLGAARIVYRRRWSARVTGGTLEGFRVRRARDDEELSPLPAIFGGRMPPNAVVEKLALGTTAYRSAVVGMPVATMHVRAAALEQNVQAHHDA